MYICVLYAGTGGRSSSSSKWRNFQRWCVLVHIPCRRGRLCPADVATLSLLFTEDRRCSTTILLAQAPGQCREIERVFFTRAPTYYIPDFSTKLKFLSTCAYVCVAVAAARACLDNAYTRPHIYTSRILQYFLRGEQKRNGRPYRCTFLHTSFRKVFSRSIRGRKIACAK